MRGRVGRLGLAHVDQRADEGGGGEEHVDVHAPAPRQVLGEDAAEDEPDRAAADRDRAEDPEGLAAVARVAERRHQRAQRGRGEHARRRRPAGPGR